MNFLTEINNMIFCTKFSFTPAAVTVFIKDAFNLYGLPYYLILDYSSQFVC